MIGLVALPAFASAAETYVVGATGNVVPDVGCLGPDPEECDLGEAITLANEDAEADTIEFVVEHVQFESELPAITFFKVKKGVVTVRDFAGGETLSLGPGKTYLATP